MNVPDLETRVRSYYERFEPTDSTRLAMASSRLLEDARRPQPHRFLWPTVRLAVTLAGAAVLLAVMVLPRLGGGIVGPGSGSGSPGPTFNLPSALNAQVDEAGLMRTGGIWAVQGSYFLTSTDNGATWRAGSFPSPTETVPLGEIFVLDQDHAWVIESNWVNGSLATPSVPGGLFVLDRTANGGRTWQSTTVSGDSRCDRTTMSFVDTNHGFIMCSTPSTAGPNGPNNQTITHAIKGSAAVLGTVDGGASWSVAGNAIGLGSQFTASDANTLWSAPDYTSSTYSGTAMAVSRDAGRTWSTVDLPDLASVPAEANVGVAAGPVFWDAADGAIAVGVFLNGSETPPAIWFYRTSDAGRSWTVVKKPTDFPMLDFPPSALVGRQWAARMLGNSNLTVSSDFGASWTVVAGSGMPENTSFLTVDLIDKDRGIATVFGTQGTRVLMQTSDGGRTWHPADFGNARAKVSSTSADPASAQNLADNFETMAIKEPPTAWNMLSAYSQKACGSESGFAAAEAALAKRTNYKYEVSKPTQSADLLSRQNLGPGLWGALNALADVSRAYVVVVTFPGTAEPAETVVAAPLAATGDWRIWATTTP